MPRHDFTVAWNANGTFDVTGNRDYVDATAFGDVNRTYLVGYRQPEDQVVNWRDAFQRMKDRPNHTKEQAALHREAVFNLFNKINGWFETVSDEAAAAGITDAKSTAELIERIKIEMQFIERREAQEKAEWLLDQHLDDQQRKTFAKLGYIQIKGADALTYRINRDAMTSVWIKGDSGRLHKHGDFCMNTEDASLPIPDKILATKLYLEANEKEYLKVANFTPHKTYGFHKLRTDGSLVKPKKPDRYGQLFANYQALDWVAFDTDEPIRLRLGDFNTGYATTNEIRDNTFTENTTTTED